MQIQKHNNIQQSSDDLKKTWLTP